MRKQEDNKTYIRPWITAAVIGAVLLLVVFVVMFRSAPHNLKNVPLSEVVQRANNGEIKEIEVDDDTVLKITKQGQSTPSEQSRKEKGVSLYDSGLSNKDVQIKIKN